MGMPGIFETERKTFKTDLFIQKLFLHLQNIGYTVVATTHEGNEVYGEKEKTWA